MRTLRRVLRGMGLWSVAFVLSGFCVLSPLAWGDFFATFAQVNVGDFGAIVCTTGLQGGARKSSAKAALDAGDCLDGGTGSATVSLVSGDASVRATGPDFSGGVTSAGASFIDTGTISGNGFLGLSGSASGASGVLNVDIFSGDSNLAAACVQFPSSNPFCPARPSWSATARVTDGMPLEVKLTISCDAPAGTDCALADPITLTLSPGVVFNSSFPGFLRGSTPEPGTLALLGSGVLGLAGVARRKLKL